MAAPQGPIMSPLTRQLTDCQAAYYKETALEPTITGQVASTLIGKVLALGISLILHAEAVYRAVVICFLSIREAFSSTNEELLKKQKQEASIAYSESMRSFFGLFHERIITQDMELPKARLEPEPKKVTLDVVPELVYQQEPQRFAYQEEPQQLVAPEPQALLQEPEVLAPLEQLHQALQQQDEQAAPAAAQLHQALQLQEQQAAPPAAQLHQALQLQEQQAAPPAAQLHQALQPQDVQVAAPQEQLHQALQPQDVQVAAPQEQLHQALQVPPEAQQQQQAIQFAHLADLDVVVEQEQQPMAPAQPLPVALQQALQHEEVVQQQQPAPPQQQPQAAPLQDVQVAAPQEQLHQALQQHEEHAPPPQEQLHQALQQHEEAAPPPQEQLHQALQQHEEAAPPPQEQLHQALLQDEEHAPPQEQLHHALQQHDEQAAAPLEQLHQALQPHDEHVPAPQQEQPQAVPLELADLDVVGVQEQQPAAPPQPLHVALHQALQHEQPAQPAELAAPPQVQPHEEHLGEDFVDLMLEPPPPHLVAPPQMQQQQPGAPPELHEHDFVDLMLEQQPGAPQQQHAAPEHQDEHDYVVLAHEHEVLPPPQEEQQVAAPPQVQFVFGDVDQEPPQQQGIFGGLLRLWGAQPKQPPQPLPPPLPLPPQPAPQHRGSPTFEATLGVDVQHDYFHQPQAQEEHKGQKKKVIEEVEVRPRSQTQVSQDLEAAIHAAENQPVVKTMIDFLEHPSVVGLDASWSFSRGRVDENRVGYCSFAEGQSLPTTVLFSTVESEINHSHQQSSLYAIFDPHASEQATTYLFAELAKALSATITRYNERGLTSWGAYNAIRSAILELNGKFVQTNPDAGCSLTVALDLGQYIWVAHLGSSGAVLANGRNLVHLASYPDPKLPKYRDMVRASGGRVSPSGLVNGTLPMATCFGFGNIKGLTRDPTITCIQKHGIYPNSHLVIATRGVFQATSQSSIVDFVHSNRAKDPLDLAHDIVYSVQKAGEEGDRSLSCLVVKLRSTE